MKNKLFVGTDITVISRFSSLCRNERFLNKVFTHNEIKYIEKRNYKAETVAGMFAAKEAASKALKTGIGEASFHDIEISRNQGISINFNKKFHVIQADVSITHDKEYAQAICAIFRAKKPIIGNYQLKERSKLANKGSLGKISIIGGSKGMVGSVHLSQEAALRTGSGVVYNIVPDCISEIMQIKSLENIILPICSKGNSFSMESIKKIVDYLSVQQAFAIGPGMSVFNGSTSFLRNVLQCAAIPCVVDADGLNALSKDLSILKIRNSYQTVLTPHPLEMARLTGIDVHEINASRINIATKFSEKHQCIVVLKGHETVIAKGNVYEVNKTGNAGMATAGAGDVLTGMITSLLGQGYDPYLAAKLGVFLHGLAGDYAKDELGEDSLLARDIIRHISRALKQLRGDYNG